MCVCVGGGGTGFFFSMKSNIFKTSLCRMMLNIDILLTLSLLPMKHVLCLSHTKLVY